MIRRPAAGDAWLKMDGHLAALRRDIARRTLLMKGATAIIGDIALLLLGLSD